MLQKIKKIINLFVSNNTKKLILNHTIKEIGIKYVFKRIPVHFMNKFMFGI